MGDTLQHLGIAVSAIVAAVGAYYAGRRNKREEAANKRDEEENKRETQAANRAEVNELLAIKDEMIAALKEDRDALKKQLTAAMAKVSELEEKVRENERDHSHALQLILEAVASGDQCLNAPSCINRRPPSALMADVKIGGTD